MKKVIIISTILCSITTNSIFGMLLKQCRTITAQKNVSLARKNCTNIKQFNYDELLLLMQKENSDLKKENLLLKQNITLLKEKTLHQTLQTDAQQTTPFRSADRDFYHNNMNKNH